MSEQKIFLSRRNLEVLLSKLNRRKEGEVTECTIIKYQNAIDGDYMQTVKVARIIAVEDEEMYANRPAGMMHPADEQDVRHATGLGVNIGL